MVDALAEIRSATSLAQIRGLAKLGMKRNDVLNILPAPILWEALRLHVSPPDGNGCILWTGRTSPKGYGWISFGGLSFTVHRLAWVAANGPMPVERQACHKCNVRLCCNHEHVYSGTARDNVLDTKRAGHLTYQLHPKRMARGERHGQSKLTEPDVVAILSSQAANSALAKRYGVDQSLIIQIRKREIWRHVSAPFSDGNEQ